jgi:hypothetical protein
MTRCFSFWWRSQETVLLREVGEEFLRRVVSAVCRLDPKIESYNKRRRKEILDKPEFDGALGVAHDAESHDRSKALQHGFALISNLVED